MERSTVENAAKLWRMLDRTTKKLEEAGLPCGDVKTARQNALRTLGKAQDAADAHEKWIQQQEHKKEN